MKVMQITAFSGWGCTGRIAEGIHNVLVDNGCESVIAWGRLNTASDDVPTIRIGTKLDYHIHGLYARLTDKCGFGSKRATRKLLSEIDSFNPDIVHLHILHSYFINIEYLFEYLRKRDIQVVWTFHDCWAFTGHCCYFDMANCEKWKTGCYECQLKSDHPASWFADNSHRNWIKKKTLLSRMNKLTVVTPSRWLASLVRESFLENCRVEVINNGINIDSFKPKYGEVHKKYSIIGKKIGLGISSSWVK
jgi:glycosyltransferase involved in cell wall biosynthesis